MPNQKFKSAVLAVIQRLCGNKKEIRVGRTCFVMYILVFGALSFLIW